MCSPIRDKKTEKKRGRRRGERTVALTKDTQRQIRGGKPIPQATAPPPPHSPRLRPTTKHCGRQNKSSVEREPTAWEAPKFLRKRRKSYIGSPLERRSTTRPLCSSGCEPCRHSAPASSATPQLHGPASASEAACSGPPWP